MIDINGGALAVGDLDHGHRRWLYSVDHSSGSGESRAGESRAGESRADVTDGRDTPELNAEIDRAVSALTEGRGCMIVISAERGMGRSAYAVAVADRARAVADGAVCQIRPPAVARTAGLDRQVSLASAPLARALYAIAAARPGGCVARLLAEGTVAREVVAREVEVGLVENVGRALLSEAGQRPIAVVVDDVHLADEDTCSLIDHLLTAIDTVPLLLVVTAARGWCAAGPAAQRWHEWIGHRSVLHIPLMPLPRRVLARAVSTTWLGNVSPRTLDAVLDAAQGNPRIAQEIVLWTLSGGRDDTLLSGSLVEQLVAAHEESSILGTLAVAGLRLNPRQVAAATSTPVGHVRQVLGRAWAGGLLDRHGRGVHGDLYAVRHPMFAAAARALLPVDLLPSIHEAIAGCLAEGESESLSERALDVARHLIAAGSGHPDTAHWCLRAATWCEVTQRLPEAVDFAREGVDGHPDPVTSVALARLHARCCGRLGDAVSAEHALRKALTIVTGDAELGAEVAVELLELGEPTAAAGSPDLLTDALAACPADRPDLLSRLRSIEAALVFQQDPAAGRRAAESAVRHAETSDDPAAAVRALTVLGRTLTDPPSPDRLDEVAARLMHYPTAEGLSVAAAAALARADRRQVDFVAREYAWRETRSPHQRVREELVLLRAGMAALDGRAAAMTHALRLLSTTADPHLAGLARLLPLLWTITNGRPLRAEAVSEGQPLPLPEPLAQLHWLGGILTRSAPPPPAEVRLMRQRLGAGQDLVRPRSDGTWAIRLAAAARLAALTGDRELCAEVVGALAPFRDQFVVGWSFLPVGPVAWFLSEPLRQLGKRAESLEALQVAEQTSLRLGAGGWLLRCLGQRCRILAAEDPGTAEDLVRASIESAAARRFPALVAELRCLLVHLRGTRDSWAARDARRGRDLSGGALTGGRDLRGGALTGGQDLRRGRAAGEEARAAGSLPHRSSDGSHPRSRHTVAQASGLTPREIEIIELAANGCTNQEIAKQLFLSVATVERHFTNIYRRLGVRNRAQALGKLGDLGLTGTSP